MALPNEDIAANGLNVETLGKAGGVGCLVFVAPVLLPPPVLAKS